ncbi:MerR family DNA-binding protein, partial [Klebsiella pneumoniae]|uniref:MerR family DNA-binding protein n=1 Tax=Klebsiella pneumoniae TaxID=573 RepID=UPI003B984671
MRLSLIVRGKRLGFSLAEMRELFELYDAEKNTPRALQQMIQAIQQRQRRLQQQQEDIQA